MAGFCNLYTYREREKKGNLEDYFTELICLMCDWSPKFKQEFIENFLGIKENEEIKIKDLILNTQVSKKSKSKENSYSRPDLIIYKDEDNLKAAILFILFVELSVYSSKFIDIKKLKIKCLKLFKIEKKLPTPTFMCKK